MKFRSINLLATFLLPCLLTLTSSPAQAEVINPIAQGFPTEGPGGTTRGPNGEYFPSGGKVEPMSPPTKGPNGEYFPTAPGVEGPTEGFPTEGPGGTTRGPNGEIFPGASAPSGQPLGEALPPYIPSTQDPSIRPLVILVNGKGDCCIQSMTNVINTLQDAHTELYVVPWNSLSKSSENDSDLNDALFKSEVANYINNKLEPNRPVILIGHSFGGDSLLKVAPLIKRRILFLGVLDPVALGGRRDIVTQYEVPANVDYFFNRWQRNRPWPIDLIDGKVQNCHALDCSNQGEQSVAKKVDGSDIRVKCHLQNDCNNNVRQVVRGGGIIKKVGGVFGVLGDVVTNDYGDAAKNLYHACIPEFDYVTIDGCVDVPTDEYI